MNNRRVFLKTLTGLALSFGLCSGTSAGNARRKTRKLIDKIADEIYNGAYAVYYRPNGEPGFQPSPEYRQLHEHLSWEDGPEKRYSKLVLQEAFRKALIRGNYYVDSERHTQAMDIDTHETGRGFSLARTYLQVVREFERCPGQVRGIHSVEIQTCPRDYPLWSYRPFRVRVYWDNK